MERSDIQIRKAVVDDWDDAMELAWKTFLKFEAKDYGQEGINSFNDFISDTTLERMFLLGKYKMFVAFQGNKMVGMITLRDKSHISLLFVDERFHRQGIGSALISVLLTDHFQETGNRMLTVNASPYGVGFYHKLGFHDVAPEMHQSGIRYTPMILGETE